jgi:PAS domain S-box-containing protein
MTIITKQGDICHFHWRVFWHTLDHGGVFMDNLFQMLAGAADGALVIDKDQRIVYWNEAAQGMLGYAAHEVIGRNCYEILRGCDDEGRLICCRRCRVTTIALADYTVPNYDLAAYTKSGDLHWINVSILSASLSGPDPAPLIVHLFRDATQKKHNEQFIRQLLGAVKGLQELAEAASSPLTIKPLVEVLTEREREVLSLLAQGLSTQDIAQSLSISSATVRNHIQNILSKLQVHSRLEAVAYAFEHGLVKEIWDRVTVSPK